MTDISRRVAATMTAGATLAVAAGTSPVRAETPSQLYVETRTVLGFRVTDAAVSALLPTGWRVAPAASGPGAGVNLSVALTERVLTTTPDGKPVATGHSWDYIFIVPGREENGPGVGAVIPLVLTRRDFTPGAYQTAYRCRGHRQSRTARRSGRNHHPERRMERHPRGWLTVGGATVRSARNARAASGDDEDLFWNDRGYVSHLPDRPGGRRYARRWCGGPGPGCDGAGQWPSVRRALRRQPATDLRDRHSLASSNGFSAVIGR
jgi:hypothetical protein